jgi:large-conductance mechanosensitive channel
MARLLFLVIIFTIAALIVFLIIKIITTPNSKEIEDQLYDLKNMRDHGLISEEEYEEKRKKLTKRL